MKIKGVFVFLLMVFSVVVFSGTASAALIDRGNGLIYDTDLNVTWYDNPNYNTATYSGYAQWAADLIVDDATNWQLPNSVAELEHLFKTELGNSTAFTNKGPFKNFAGDYHGYYAQPDNGAYYYYSFDVGAAYPVDISYWYYWIHGLAVHDGDVGASTVPIPAAVWLFGTGLLGLFGVRRKIRK